MLLNIDIVCFNCNVEHPAWKHGSVFHSKLQSQVFIQDVDNLIGASTADWILFWDYSLGQPDEGLITQLALAPVDVFHAGLKLGTRALPDVMNYVHPTWMYNIDGSDNVTHSNFRMSFSAALVRLPVLKLLRQYIQPYTSWQMLGVAFGYSVILSGGIIRYYADMMKQQVAVPLAVPLKDEWIFARSFFEPRWQFWTLMNKPGLLANIRAWSATRYIPYQKPQRSIHPSGKINQPVPNATVSILAPTLDRYAYLEEELRELNEQTILPYEVLITDQTDKQRRQSIDFSRYNNLTIKYFPQDEKGQCIAWNKLIEEATGEYVFFFGDDAYDIKPSLIEKMLQTMHRFNADMVASNVREKGIVYGATNYHYYMSDSFPITLIKKSVVTKAGGMDMFFNRNVKADHDLAMRCHLNGALMIFDPSAEIGHHRAPSGGLRTHNARVITNFMAKNTLTKILNPSSSEIFIYKRYYSAKQYGNHVKIKYINQLLTNGNIFRKFLRLLVMLYKLPVIKKAYKANLHTAMEELNKRGIPVDK
jgi:glycosyltransferase involved in cell wall biosynthesis